VTLQFRITGRSVGVWDPTTGAVTENIVATDDGKTTSVTLPLQPHEFDALVSFHYNTGGIAKASLTRHLNADNRAAAAQAFMGWLRPAAIRSRREAERDLFRDGRYPTGTIPVWAVDRNGRVEFSRPVRRRLEWSGLMKDRAGRGGCSSTRVKGRNGPAWVGGCLPMSRRSRRLSPSWTPISLPRSGFRCSRCCPWANRSPASNAFNRCWSASSWR
jgi:hypothetical protein